MKLPYSCPENKKLRLILSLDTDDETALFALAHCIASPEFEVCGVAAKGETASKASELARAAGAELRIENDLDFAVSELQKCGKKLWILCMGSLGDAARLAESCGQIPDRFVFVWTGSGKTPEGADEPNYAADPRAAERLMASGAQLYVIPMKAYRKVRVSLAQLQLRLESCGEVGALLFNMLCLANKNDAEGAFQGEAWVLPGEAAVSVLLCPEQRTWSLEAPVYGDKNGRAVRVYENVDNRMVLEDFFAKMRLCFGQ